LPKSHSHYKDFLDLRGDGRVVLYKRADHENPKWTVRLKIPEVPGFVVKSTKTTDDFEARRFAEDLYYRLEGKARRGEPINSPTFRRVFTEWAKVPVADQVVRSARYVNGNVRRVEIWAPQYFGDFTIDKVTEAKLADYVDWRLSQPRRPAIVTLKNERTAIRQLLRFAKRRGYISDVPEFAVKSGRTNARPDIPEVEWHRLTRLLPLYIDRAQDKRRQRERFYLALYILIMGNTGLRIGEARRLRWRDVSTTRTLTDWRSSRSGERPGNGKWSATRGSSATWMSSDHSGPRSWAIHPRTRNTSSAIPQEHRSGPSREASNGP
jgi:integrase